MNLLGLSGMIALPLVAGLLLLFLSEKQARLMRWLTALVLALECLMGFRLVWLFQTEASDFSGVNARERFFALEQVPWFRLSAGGMEDLSVNYFVGLDGLNAGLLLLALVVLLLGALASGGIQKHVRAYFALYLLLSSAVIGTFVALDFFLFYLCFEFMLLPMYFLIGIWGGKAREYAAIKFFIYTLVGSVLILVVGIGLALSTHVPELGHSFSLVDFTRPEAFLPEGYLSPGSDRRPLFFALLMLGFAIKLPAVPVHTWLPDAHVQAPTPISMILAGILLKIGGYGMMRMGMGIFPETFAAYSQYIALAGIIAILYGGVVALGQTNFKKLIAYSSVSHMGFVLLGLATLTNSGVQGALYQMLSHGIISPLLFFLVGVLYERTHELEMERYSGLYSKLPRYTGFVTVAFFASLGLPTFSGFVAELMVLLGAFKAPQLPVYWAVLAACGLILAAAYYLWNFKKMFLGKYWLHPEVVTDKLTDMRPLEIGIALVLVLLTVFMGVYPAALLDLQTHSIGVLLDLFE